MYQKILLLAFIGLSVLSCGNTTQTENVETSSNQPNSSVEDQSKIGRTNYAVLWKWATDDVELVSSNSVQISEELSNLWKEDIIENAYYDPQSKVDKLAYFPNIAFFLKTKDEAAAKAILDDLTVVTKGIATYQLHPVGQLWLNRNTDVVKKNGPKKSFATVWTTTKSPLEGQNADVLLQKQNDAILQLWNDGIIENVYFDIEGTYTSNDKTDFVFFINANTEAEAIKICESLPFFQEKMTTYKIHPAGVFWMGKYENQ